MEETGSVATSDIPGPGLDSSKSTLLNSLVRSVGFMVCRSERTGFTDSGAVTGPNTGNRHDS